MTTTAMPELPEPELGYIETDKSRQPAFSARQMREALQSAQPAAAVSDGEIDAVSLAQWGPHHGAPLAAHRAFARAILALRAQAVPMTDEADPCPGCQKGRVCRTPKCGRLELPINHPYRTGITQRADGGEKQA